jgi:hypothetical protein
VTASDPANGPQATPAALPRWARAADAAAVILLLVTLSVLAFGGFRVWIGETRLSVTSWVRPAIMALALIAVRHGMVRWRPLPRRLADGVSRWWSAPDTRLLLPIHLATRVGVLIVGFLAVVEIGFPEPNLPFRVYENEFLNLPARYDTGWYLAIANEGYRWSPSGETSFQNITFFPAFPLLVRYLSVVLGRAPIWAGVGISFVAFYGAMVYLLRLARQDLDDESRALAAVALLATYPFAVYFSAAYTESLFLLGLVGAIHHFRHHQLWRAAGWGALCGLTRPNGAMLSIVLALIVVQAWRADRQAGVEPGRWPTWSAYLDRLAAAAAPGLGMLAYSTYILFLTGNPFQWAAHQPAWERVYRSLDTVVTDRVQFVAQHGLYDYVSSQTIDMLWFLSALFVLAAVWPVYRRFGLPYAALILVTVVPPLAVGGVLSMGRLTSVLFPVFFWLAAVLPPPHRLAVAVAFASLQAFAAVLFFTWRPLF